MRDDFSTAVKSALAKRVGHVCSRPDCGALTSGPHKNPGKAVTIGEAAHITAASPGGPRYDPNLSEEERCGPENGIWLCSNCATLIDKNPDAYPPQMLREWKAKAEAAAAAAIGKMVQPKEVTDLRELSEKLKAPRPEPGLEKVGLDLLWRNFKFYMRVVRLIEDIGNIKNNDIVNVYRGAEYDDAKRALLAKFGEEYSVFQEDFEKAIELLDAVSDASEEPKKSELTAIIEAARETATTVAELIDWSQDKRNEPMNLGRLHERPKYCDAAREASKRLSGLVANYMIARGMS